MKFNLARIAMLLFFVSSVSVAENSPEVLGYGVKSCSAYLDTYARQKKGEDIAILEYLRYQDWVTGLVTGLSLATAMNVLGDVDVESVMRRVQIECEEHPDEDFFTATTKLIKQISSLK